MGCQALKVGLYLLALSGDCEFSILGNDGEEVAVGDGAQESRTAGSGVRAALWCSFLNREDDVSAMQARVVFPRQHLLL